MADCFPQLTERVKKGWKKLSETNNKTVIELNYHKCHDLSVTCRSIASALALQTIDLLATYKPQYFAQPCPIILWLLNNYMYPKYYL